MLLSSRIRHEGSFFFLVIFRLLCAHCVVFTALVVDQTGRTTEFKTPFRLLNVKWLLIADPSLLLKALMLC